MVAAAVAGAALVGGVVSADAQRKAGNRAADAQLSAADAGITEQRRQFDAVQQLLNPFVKAGNNALTGQMDLLGRNGNDAQAAAIQALQSSPQFTSALKLGEDRILANASATGGLRGGNVQAALGQFSPALLAATINDQYAKLGGLTTLGANAAAGVGSAGMQTGDAVSRLLAQQGQARAGAAMSQGKSTMGYAKAIGNAFGAYAGYGGDFGGGLTIDPNGYGIDPYGYLGGARTAGDFSDVRLKTDVRPLGVARNGLPLYSFRYVWGGPERIGHLAHEVAAVFPDAVSRHPSGFLMVDYSKV